MAEEPQHRRTRYRPIQPGQTYSLTVGQAVLCEASLEPADAIRVRDGLAVVLEHGRLVLRPRVTVTGEPVISPVQPDG